MTGFAGTMTSPPLHFADSSLNGNVHILERVRALADPHGDQAWWAKQRGQIRTRPWRRRALMQHRVVRYMRAVIHMVRGRARRELFPSATEGNRASE